MKTMQREFEALLDMQRFDAGELDYAVLDRHVARLTQLSQVVNSGITVFGMYRRRSTATVSIACGSCSGIRS